MPGTAMGAEDRAVHQISKLAALRHPACYVMEETDYSKQTHNKVIIQIK